LIDNGFSGKELLRRLQVVDIDPETLSALVITHEHGDHIKGVGVLARRFNLPIYANDATYRAAAATLGHLPARHEFATGERFVIGDLEVHPFAVSHDSVDPVGFVLGNGLQRLGYCTDTGTITRLIRHRLRECQALILEANHDVEMLRQGPYPLPLQQRVLSTHGHLSNPDALGFAEQMAEGSLRCLMLAHLSEVNNHPELVVDEARRHLSSRKDLSVMLAEQMRPSPLIEIGP
jgi:phosphoribosyl 1,2-cyclic phosphodiesterase